MLPRVRPQENEADGRRVMPGFAYAVAERRCWVCEREGEAPARAVGSRVVSTVFCVPRVAAAVRSHERYRAEAQPWRARIIMGSECHSMLVKIMFASSRTTDPLHIHIYATCTRHRTFFLSFIIVISGIISLRRSRSRPKLRTYPVAPALSHTDSAMCLVLAVQTGRTLRNPYPPTCCILMEVRIPGPHDVFFPGHV